jgi:hypothetical protein
MEHELETKAPRILVKKGAHASPRHDIPANTSGNPMRQLQQTIGNHAVQRLIQTKLQVSQPGDAYEQEADHVAASVLNMPAAETSAAVQRQTPPNEEDKDKVPAVQRKTLAESITPLAQRQMVPDDEDKDKKPVQTKRLGESISSIAQRQAVPEDEKDKTPVQTKALTGSTVQLEASDEGDEHKAMQMKSAPRSGSAAGGMDASVDIEQKLGHSKGSGNALPDPVRGFMEPRFGTDFSGVRVHTGHESVQMSQALNAQAFTVGQDIYYGQGKSPSDLSLTAHELTHVVQQTGDVQTKLQRACPTCAAGGPPCAACQGESKGAK